MIANITKLDFDTQWVRGRTPQVPPAQSLASRAVANLTCIIGNGGFGAEGSEITGRITESRKLANGIRQANLAKPGRLSIYTRGPFRITPMGEKSRQLAMVWKAVVV